MAWPELNLKSQLKLNSYVICEYWASQMQVDCCHYVANPYAGASVSGGRVRTGVAVEVVILECFEMLSDAFSFLLCSSYKNAKENDITWSYLLTMEKEDLEKVETDYSICVSASFQGDTERDEGSC